MDRYDIVVVGGGPAGLTAALYGARAGRRVLVLEGTGFGGQIVNSPRVENYPGISQISGSAFADQLMDQVLGNGVEVEFSSVTALRREPEGFRLETEGEPVPARTVILATGVQHRGLGLEGEEALVGNGISYCALCDGAFFQNRPVGVVGGGDTALQEALFLSGICSKVTLIHRREQFRGQARLVEELRNRENVEFLLGYTISSLREEEGNFRGATVRNVEHGQETELTVDGLFLAVGQQPNNTPFSPPLELDEAGYVLAEEDGRTSVPGLFAAGDCRRKAVRQLATAVGDGAVAAVAACDYLDRHGS